jgi:large conductance mechanosensitive channel
MLKEFKEFALKGNLVDLAIAFVMGAAFTKLSTAFIDDLFMPLIGSLTPGGLDFSNHFIPLSSKVLSPVLAVAKQEGAVLAYGNFISVGLNFIIVAFAMFLVVKAINRAKRVNAQETEVVAAAAPAAPSGEEKLLEEIRDLLKSNR